MAHPSGLGRGIGPGYAFDPHHPSDAHHQTPFQPPHPEHFQPTSPNFTGTPTLAGSVTPSCTTPPMGTTSMSRFPLSSPRVFHGDQRHATPVSPSRNVMDPGMQLHYSFPHYRGRRPSYSDEPPISLSPGGTPHLPGYGGGVMPQPMPSLPPYSAQNVPKRNQPAKGARRNPGLRIDFSPMKGADGGHDGQLPNAGPYPSPILRSPTYQTHSIPGGPIPANVSEEVKELRRKVAECVYQNVEVIKKRYQHNLQELFFLQHGGNIINFLVWKQKPSPQWLTFQATYKLEDDIDFLTPASPFGPNQVHNVGNVDYITLQHKFYSGNPLAANMNQTFGTVMSPSVPAYGNIPNPQNAHSSGHISHNPAEAHIDLSSSKLFLSKDPGFGQSFPTTSSRHGSTTASTQGGGLSDGRSLVFREVSHSKEDIMLEARKEADILKRVAELRKEGLWSTKRLPKVQEPSRNKAHWDYVLEEMAWLATDFAQEQRWKKGVAKKVSQTTIS